MKILTLCSTLFLAVAAAGCITATVTEPAACDSKSVSFDLSDALASAESQLPPGAAGANLSQLCATGGAPSVEVQAATETTYQLPPLTTSTDFDFSGDLSKIDDVAKSVQMSVTKLMLDNTSGVLDFVSHIEVDMQTNSMPVVVLATYDATSGTSTDLNVQVKASSDVILSYLESGDTTLTVTLDSKPVDLSEVCVLATMPSLSTHADMCIKASGTFSK